MDEKTARKYRRKKQLPSQMRQPQRGRTRPDPFEGVWDQIQEILGKHPTLQAKTMFEHLCRKHPGESFRKVSCEPCSAGLSSGGFDPDRSVK